MDSHVFQGEKTFKSIHTCKILIFSSSFPSRCIPENGNAINRTERSQAGFGGGGEHGVRGASEPSEASSLHDLFPNWHFLALGGLLIFLLLLMVIIMSLVRHVHRLKSTLRRSAEVLAPTGSNGAHGGHALINGYATTVSAANGNGRVVHYT